ncbi:MAG TPA: TlpA disulfide reductase family protein [Thermoleophilaceae bacterium]
MRLGLVITIIVVGAIVVLAIARGGNSNTKSSAPGKAAETKAFEGSPPALASVHSQEGQLLGGGSDAFKQRLVALKGHEVVVNKWAAWCGPCRQEFPVFQKVAVQYGKNVAFLGVDSQDSSGDAKRFLGQYPVSYPSYSDPDLKIAQSMDAVGAFPTTVIYNRAGKKVSTHIGPYTKDADLVADIKRYDQ